jgi:hypothetical protein
MEKLSQYLDNNNNDNDSDDDSNDSLNFNDLSKLAKQNISFSGAYNLDDDN